MALSLVLGWYADRNTDDDEGGPAGTCAARPYGLPTGGVA